MDHPTSTRARNRDRGTRRNRNSKRITILMTQLTPATRPRRSKRRKILQKTKRKILDRYCALCYYRANVYMYVCVCPHFAQMVFTWLAGASTDHIESDHINTHIRVIDDSDLHFTVHSSCVPMLLPRPMTHQ